MSRLPTRNSIIAITYKLLQRKNLLPHDRAFGLLVTHTTSVLFGEGTIQPKDNISATIYLATEFIIRINEEFDAEIDEAICVDHGRSNNYWSTVSFMRRAELFANRKVIVYVKKGKYSKCEVIFMHEKS